MNILWRVLHIRNIPQADIHDFSQCFHIVWPCMWPVYRQGVSRSVVWVQGSAHSSLCKHTSKKTTKKTHCWKTCDRYLRCFQCGCCYVQTFLIISYNACDSICVLQINRLRWYSVADRRWSDASWRWVSKQNCQVSDCTFSLARSSSEAPCGSRVGIGTDSTPGSRHHLQTR